MFDTTELSTAARAVATESCHRAGVEVRPLERADDLRALSAVLSAVWQVEDGLISSDLLVALAHAGNYIVGAYAADRLVGGCIGFFGEPLGVSLHSHIAGVVPALAGRGVGTAMKQHQRAWCLDRGIVEITWTYDPLIARNAAFNLIRLGARVEEYLVDLYGRMEDGLNRGQPSDRLWVVWDLVDPRPPLDPDQASAHPVELLGESADGRPVVSTGPKASGSVVLRVPRDVEGLRIRDPELAERWRYALRDTMVTLLADGWSVVGFDRTAVAYRLSHEPGQEAVGGDTGEGPG